MNKALVSIIAPLALLLTPLAAFAQTTPGDDIIRKSVLSEQDKQVIKAFVDANKAGLSGTPAEIKRSREALTGPLERSGVSVPFRLALADNLVERLKTLAADKDRDVVAANALHLAGELATNNTMPVLSGGLKDPRESVRYAATHGYARMFAAADKAGPAISADDGAKALRELAEVLKNDKSARVSDGATIAMIESRGFMKSMGVQRLAEAAGQKAIAMAKGSEPADLTSVVRAAGALRAALYDTEGVAKPTPDAVKASAEFAGRSLVLISAQLKAGGDRAVLVQGAKANIGILGLAGQTMGGATIDDHIGRLLETGKDAEFQKAVEGLVGPQGPLVNPPFNIDPKSFKP